MRRAFAWLAVAVLCCAARAAAGEQGPADWNRAEELYKRALETAEATKGRNHPDVADLLTRLAQLRLANGRVDKALPLLQRAFAISELRLRREGLDLSEARLASLIAHLRVQEELLYALARALPFHEEVRHLALTAALLRKGRSVEELADTSRTAYLRVSAKDRDAFARLRELRGQLASLSLQGPGAARPEGYQQRLRALAEQGDALEADLAKRSAPLRALTTLPLPEQMVEQVADALPPSSALVEFITYMDRPILDLTGTPAPPRLRYLALVLFSNGKTHAVDLGAAAPIDSAAARLRDALARRDAGFLEPTVALYRLVFRPLRELLDGTRQVFLSPDGQLGLVPFAALHDGEQFLVESFNFTYLTSGKDLLPRAQGVVPSSSVVVMADPDFNSAALPGAGKAPVVAQRSVFVERFFSTSRADVAQRPWLPLPGTRREAEAIQRLVPQAQLYLGQEATKERLLGLSSPGVLHLATHGFFLEDAATQEGARAVGSFGAVGAGAPLAPPADPLLRSGLVLAGAQSPAPESVLVTALELASLNLWGTQLVVLSACDTGRGDVKLGQGVYGLRRAFVAAGAETVVMSLWKVNDEATQVLMKDYYTNLLSGEGRATALRGAMANLRRTHPHPHYWAPFIVSGRDTRLRLMRPRSPGN